MSNPELIQEEIDRKVEELEASYGFHVGDQLEMHPRFSPKIAGRLTRRNGSLFVVVQQNGKTRRFAFYGNPWQVV